MAEVVKIVDPGNGAGTDYTSLNAWEAGQNGDLTSGARDGEIAVAKCRSTGGAEDTAAVVIAGWTTSATEYIKIWCDPSESYRHAGVWNNNKYRLNVNGASAISVGEEFVVIDGVQVTKTSTADGQYCIYQDRTLNTPNSVVISNCIVKGGGGTTYYEKGLASGGAGAWTVYNCVIYNISTKASTSAVGVHSLGTTFALYSSTVIGGYRGVYANGSGEMTVKNVYAGGSSSEDFYRESGTLVKVNCASEDQSADDAPDGNETATDCVAAAVDCTTDGVTFVAPSTGDWRMVVTGALVGAGTDTSSDIAGTATDVSGATRTTTWDIGAFEYIAAKFARPSSDVAGGTFRSIVTTAPFGPRVIA